LSDHWNAKYPKPLSPFWQSTVKFAALVVLTGLMFLLAESMVEHRFFQGGWVDDKAVLR
jgi:hypothetical protein